MAKKQNQPTHLSGRDLRILNHLCGPPRTFAISALDDAETAEIRREWFYLVLPESPSGAFIFYIRGGFINKVYIRSRS